MMFLKFIVSRDYWGCHAYTKQDLLRKNKRWEGRSWRVAVSMLMGRMKNTLSPLSKTVPP